MMQVLPSPTQPDNPRPMVEVSYAAYRHIVGSPLSATFAGLELLRACLDDPASRP